MSRRLVASATAVVLVASTISPGVASADIENTTDVRDNEIVSSDPEVQALATASAMTQTVTNTLQTRAYTALGEGIPEPISTQDSPILRDFAEAPSTRPDELLSDTRPGPALGGAGEGGGDIQILADAPGERIPDAELMRPAREAAQARQDAEKAERDRAAEREAAEQAEQAEQARQDAQDEQDAQPEKEPGVTVTVSDRDTGEQVARVGASPRDNDQETEDTGETGEGQEQGQDSEQEQGQGEQSREPEPVPEPEPEPAPEPCAVWAEVSPLLPESVISLIDALWLDYGGEQYAPSFFEADPGAQLAVAQQVVTQWEPGLWPTC